MARDYAAIMGATQEARAATVQNEVLSLPPGYLVGFDIRLRPDYTVLIYAGAANVGGSLVNKATDHLVEDADWVAPKIDSKHYYIYLSKDGSYKIDLIIPVWNSDLLYYEHPTLQWRAIGKLFYVAGSVIFAIKEVEKTEQTVTVAPDGFTGRADYYCIHDSPYGNSDQILINAAIRYLHEAYDGGECKLLRGIFRSSGTIYINCSNITLSGESKHGSLVYYSGNGVAIELNVAATVLNNNKITSVGIIEDGGSTPNGINPYRCQNLIISECFISGMTQAIHCYGDNHISVLDNYIYQFSYGIYLDPSVSSGKIIVSGNILDGNSSGTYGVITQATGSDIIITDNKIYGMTGTTLSEAILINSDNVVCTNNIIYNITTSSAGSGYGILLSADHCVVKGNIIYSVTAGTVANAYGIYLQNGDYSVIAENNIHDNGQYGIYITSGASPSIVGNYCYNNGSDTGIANTNQNNFYDGGTDTQVYSNSWQQPVAGEPTQGELKWLPQATSTLTGYVLAAATTTAAWSSVSCGAVVPVGAKSVYVTAIISASSSAAGDFYHYVCFSSDTSVTPVTGDHHPQINVRNYGSGSGILAQALHNLTIPLDSSRKFYYYARSRSNASLCTLGCAILGYTV